MALVLVAGGSLVARAAPAAQPGARDPLAGVPTTSLTGGRGILRGAAAEGQGEGAFTLTAGQTFFTAGELLGVSDTRDLFYQTHASVAWDPTAFLQVILGGSFTGDRHVGPDGVATTVRQTGSPELAIRGHLGLTPHWRVGAEAGIVVPTSPAAAGLAFGSSVYHGRLLASHRPSDPWLLAVDVDAFFDHSRALVAGAPSDAQRLALQIWDSSHLAWTVGAQRHIARMGALDALAFAEAHQDIPLAAHQQVAAPRLAVGARALVGSKERLEVVVGADARLGPGLDVGARQPAAPPWQIFAQLALHLQVDRPGQGAAAASPRTPPLLQTSKELCSWDADCTNDRSCQNGECVLPPSPAAQVVPVKAPEAPKTYVVIGHVEDAESHQPVLDATAVVKGFPEARLAVEPSTGTFHTWPLTGDDEVDIVAQADGYLPTHVRVRPFESRRHIRVTFVLRPDPKARPVTVRGLMRDRIWGTPVRGTALVTAKGRVIKAQPSGALEFAIAAGRHEMVFAAPGYVSQRRYIVGTTGEVVILNVDMEPFGTRRPAP